jgi:hypothetical protein
MSDEHRRAQRQRTYKGGHINRASGPGIDCLIRNLSDTGACLEIESGRIPDDRFQLVIKPESLVRICEVAWRKPQKIGVRFVF